MHFPCPNCDEYIELPEVIGSIDECICSACASFLHLDLYRHCTHCDYYYLKQAESCLYCSKSAVENEVPPLSYIYVRSEEDYKQALNYFESRELLAVDTEGNSLSPFDNELLLVQTGDAVQVFLFDHRWYPRLADENFWREPRKLFLMHNAKYDLKVLKYSLGIEMGCIFDTMLAERLLTCGLERKNSLKAVAEKYLGLKMDKEIRDDFINMSLASYDAKISTQLLEYSARDVQSLPLIYAQQKSQLLDEGLMRLALLEFEVCKVISDMELRGIYVDTAGWQRIIENNTARKQEIEQQIYDYLAAEGILGGIFGETVLNLNSTKELLAIFKRLRIALTSTGEEELASIDHPFTKLLREYRKCEKQLSAFGESFLELVRKETSRVHPSYNQIGADTGRFSCTQPNLQQIPATAEYRQCFVSPAGRRIVTCDYSQQELRILASLSGDPKFIKFYEDGVDLHSATASMMFNVPMDKVEKDTHRKVAKTINFGLAYGQGAAKLGLTIGMSTEQAEGMIEKYFAQFSFIGDWLENAARTAKSLGYSKTLLGRKRYYDLPPKSTPEYGRIMSAIGRRGKNTPIQGSGVDMVKLALVKIDARLRSEKLDAFLINTVHDEIVVEASEADASRALEILQEAMEEAGRQLAPNVPIVAEGAVGEYWSH